MKTNTTRGLLLILASLASLPTYAESVIKLVGPIREDLPLDPAFNGYFQYGDVISLTITYETFGVTDENPAERIGWYNDSVQSAVFTITSSAGDLKYMATAASGRIQVYNGDPACASKDYPPDPACDGDPQRDYFNVWMYSPEWGGTAQGDRSFPGLRLNAFFTEFNDYTSVAIDSALIPEPYQVAQIPTHQVQLSFRGDDGYGHLINTIDYEIIFDAREVSCEGFEHPLNAESALRIRKDRVLPLRVALTEDATPLGESDLMAPPVLQVSYQPFNSTGAVNIEDLQYVGLGDAGNSFTFKNGGWSFNLLAKDWAPGTYRLSVLAGSPEYQITPSCSATVTVD